MEKYTGRGENCPAEGARLSAKDDVATKHTSRIAPNLNQEFSTTPLQVYVDPRVVWQISGQHGDRDSDCTIKHMKSEMQTAPQNWVVMAF